MYSILLPILGYGANYGILSWELPDGYCINPGGGRGLGLSNRTSPSETLGESSREDPNLLRANHLS